MARDASLLVAGGHHDGPTRTTEREATEETKYTISQSDNLYDRVRFFARRGERRKTEASTSS
jgi:hypothetical protein